MNARDEESRRAQEDAEWQALVDGYGDRPEFPDVAADPEPEPILLEPAGVIDEPRELHDLDDDDRFVPPPAPPVPRPHGIRGLAWFGLFGVPVLVLACIVLRVSLPTVISLLFLAWFVGGFGYLVATMNGPRDPDAGWDDGAVL